MANKRNPKLERSDIPYAERLRLKKLQNIAAHRDDAHLTELKIALVSLNESEGLGYVRLSRFAQTQQKNRDAYYKDPEYESVKLDQAVRQLGFIVEDGRLICAVDEEGNIVPTKRLDVEDKQHGGLIEED